MSNVIESKSPVVIAPPYRTSLAEIIGLLQSDAAHGLSKVEAAERLEKYGPNQLESKAPVPAWKTEADCCRPIMDRLEQAIRIARLTNCRTVAA